MAFHIAQLLCYCEKDNLCSLLDSGRKIFYWSKLTMLRSMSPAVSSGEERGLLSRTAASNRAYTIHCIVKVKTGHFQSLRPGSNAVLHTSRIEFDALR